MALDNFISRFLKEHYIILNIFTFVSAFACYFSVYAFRKTFTAASFEGVKLWDVDFKIMAITFQQIGYTLVKFLGIKFIAELNPRFRALWILGAILVAEAALILFGAVPAPYNCIFMFFNGMPLGLLWGLIFSYLEGRRTSEILGSGMAISFIVASGAVKSVGSQVLQAGFISQYWMPAFVGAIFFPLTLLTVFFLECIPPPDEKDIEARTERVAMSGADRIKFIKTFGPGIASMTLFYMCLTAYRDFRDNFAPELWEAFGYTTAPSIFTTSEIIVAVVIVVPIALFMLFKSRMQVFVAYHITIIGGQILVLLCAILAYNGSINGLTFMIITGIGLYVGYVPFNSILFDLFIATFKYPANSGFIQCICDSFGYLSSIVILFVKNFATTNLSWLSFFIYVSYGMAGVGILTISLSLTYYIFKFRTWKPLDTAEQLDELEGDIQNKDEISTNSSSDKIDINEALEEASLKTV